MKICFGCSSFNLSLSTVGVSIQIAITSCTIWRTFIFEHHFCGERGLSGSMRSLIVFLFVVSVLLGVPVWWKTTEVRRAPLPHHRIQALYSPEVVI